MFRCDVSLSSIVLSGPPGPPPGAPKLSFLGSIASGAKLKKVDTSENGGGDDKPPAPPGRANLMSQISGGASQLKRRDTAPPTKSGGSMADAIAAQKDKVFQIDIVL